MSDGRAFDRVIAALGWAGVVFLVFPVAVTVIVSFGASPFIELPPRALTLAWYANIGAIHRVLDATLVSLGVAFAAASLVTVLGMFAALALVRMRFPGKPAVTSFLLSPIAIPTVAIGIALVQIFIRLDIAFTWGALVLAHMVLVAAYPVRTIVAALSLSDPSLEEAAATLGANPVVTFLTVTLPQMKPGLVAGFLFAFLISFDNYPISIFLVRGALTTMPIEVFNYISQNFDPTPAAFSTLYVLIVTIVIVALEKRYKIISLAVR